MGDWANGVAKGSGFILDRLAHLPGPMCAKIDVWASQAWDSVRGSRHRSSPTKLDRAVRGEADDADYRSLHEQAERIEAERDLAIEGLEECRSALDALRERLVEVVMEAKAVTEERDALLAETHSRGAA